MIPYTPTYCTPEDVAETLDLPDPNDNYVQFAFSTTTHPSYSRVQKLICSNEDIIDRRLRRSWRENRVKDQLLSIESYWHDINAWRGEYYVQNGNYIQLRKNVREWDTTKGDKLEIRFRGGVWQDISDQVQPKSEDGQESTITRFDFDYAYGKLYMRTRLSQPLANAVRISYRYGSSEDVPAAISRLCALLTAIQILSMQAFNIKVGMGGDLGQVRQEMINAYTEEANTIYSSFQRVGSVHSLLR